MNVNNKQFEDTTNRLLNEEISDVEDGLEKMTDSQSEQDEGDVVTNFVNKNQDSSNVEFNEVHNINSLRNILQQHGNNQDTENSSEDHLEEGIDLDTERYI